PVRLGDGVAYGLSPDGKWVAGFSSRDTANRMFELMPTGPGEALKSRMVVGWLAGKDSFLVTEKSPSGAGERYELWNAAANTFHQLSPDGMPETDEFPLVSPDGRLFVAVGANGEHRVYPIDGGEAKAIPGLTPHDRLVGWRSDGRS